jgi:cyclophilin family peptidyl-prolyl cis-trans isomerase
MKWYWIFVIIVLVLLTGYGGYKGYQYMFPKKESSVSYSHKTVIEPGSPKVKNMETKIEQVERDRGREFVNYEDLDLHPYFEIQIGEDIAGIVKFQLFDTDVPKTCKNFRYLCCHSLFKKDRPDYEGTLFHRVIPNFMIQGGDITNGDGTGGMSIYGDTFEDENFELKHNQPGLLSMANAGPNTNSSQFFITTNKTPWLDGKHVVFGIVTSGYNIIERIEKLERDENDKTIVPVTISKCGFDKML